MSRRRVGFWLIVIAAFAALLLVWQYISYLSFSRTLPEGMTIADLPVGGMTPEQALDAVDAAFATPLEVSYQDEQISLFPDSVELRHNIEQTADNLDQVLISRGGLEDFWRHILRRPVDAVDVPAAVTYSEERVAGFLARMAMQYDHPPQGPVPLPERLTFRPGQPGYVLDAEASQAQLEAALVSAGNQRVELVVLVEPAPNVDLSVLADLITPLLEDHPAIIPGIFIKDLQTGQELEINGDVAFSGLSVLKIAIMEETYHILDAPLSVEITDWISGALGLTSSNFMANLLLRDVIGDGDGYQGAENLTASMNRLGLVNTFMVAPYDADCTYTLSTPANSRSDIDTAPDICMQTTPLDMGLMLEMIYQCSEGGGTLMAAYPDAFTVDECQQMIDRMTMNEFDNLIEAGLPEGTVVAHKHGFGDGGPHADAGIVFSPGGDFVLVVFLNSAGYLEWAESSVLLADIATATYNYFNPAQ